MAAPHYSEGLNMKKQVEAKRYRVKALRGFVGEDGKTVEKGKTVTVSRNLSKILTSTGRGEIVEGAAKEPAAS